MFAEPFDLYRALDPQAVQDVFCDALEAAGREEEAMAAFRAALTRDGLRTRVSVRATNNLAKLLAARGRLPEARALLSQALEAFPEGATVGYEQVNPNP